MNVKLFQNQYFYLCIVISDGLEVLTFNFYLNNWSLQQQYYF